jgi:hypothetical protein
VVQFSLICGKRICCYLSTHSSLVENIISCLFCSPMGKKQQKSAKNDKATRKGWTTNEQFEFLTSLLPSFINAQLSKTTADQWPTIYEEWFKQWPLDPPTPKDIANGHTEEVHTKAMKTVSNAYLLSI